MVAPEVRPTMPLPECREKGKTLRLVRLEAGQAVLSPMSNFR
jgi:hypothetical protein